MSKRSNAAVVAPIFAALGDETRLSLVNRLSAGKPLSIAELTDGTQMTRQAVTKHLSVLTDAGLVDHVREGRERRFELKLRHIAQAQRCLEQISHDWDAAIERLRKLVEE